MRRDGPADRKAVPILGIVLFGDPAGVARIACIGLIVAGIVGLKLAT